MAAATSSRGNGGDDFIDGDAWLNVRIRITSPGTENTAENQIATVDSLKHVFADDFSIVAWRGKSLFELLVDRTIVPAQMHIVREIITEGGEGDTDVAAFNDILANYTITGNGDGTITVTHVTVSDVIDPLTERPLVSDDVDTLRNVEVLRFADQDVVLSPPDLKLNGFDSSNYRDQFDAAAHNNSNGTFSWTATPWVETNDALDGNVVTGGQIQIDGTANDVMLFTTGDGAQIERTMNLAGATRATLSYAIAETGFEGAPDNDTVRVFFSRDGTDFVQVDLINNTTNNATRNIDLTQFGTGPFTANAAVRFVANNLEAADTVTINNLNIQATGTGGNAYGRSLSYLHRRWRCGPNRLASEHHRRRHNHCVGADRAHQRIDGRPARNRCASCRDRRQYRDGSRADHRHTHRHSEPLCIPERHPGDLVSEQLSSTGWR